MADQLTVRPIRPEPGDGCLVRSRFDHAVDGWAFFSSPGTSSTEERWNPSDRLGHVHLTIGVAVARNHATGTCSITLIVVYLTQGKKSE